jgi:hypothetical protein
MTIDVQPRSQLDLSDAALSSSRQWLVTVDARVRADRVNANRFVLLEEAVARLGGATNLSLDGRAFSATMSVEAPGVILAIGRTVNVLQEQALTAGVGQLTVIGAYVGVEDSRL